MTFKFGHIRYLQSNPFNMKPAFDLRRVASCQVGIHAVSVGLSLALPLLCGGCKKDSVSTTGTSAPVAAAVPTSAAPTASVQPLPSASAPAATNAAPDLRAINRALIIWSVHHRRQPSSFEEFAASAGVQIPSPPPGKKYIIDSNGLISLVNR